MPFLAISASPRFKHASGALRLRPKIGGRFRFVTSQRQDAIFEFANECRQRNAQVPSTASLREPLHPEFELVQDDWR